MRQRRGRSRPGASTQLFIRQTSGLVRELGIPAAIGISLASVAVVNTFINFNAGLTDFPKSDMYLPLVAAAVIWLVAMFAYRYLLRAVPRAGGEYVYLSRIVSPAVGAMAGLGIAVVFTYVLSTNAHFAAQFTPFMLTGLGLAFHSTAIANAGNHFGSNLSIAWLSVILMLIVAALSLFKVKIVARIIFSLIILQVVAFVALIGILAFKSHADFVTAFGSFSHHPGAYQATITAAHANGVVFGTSIASAVAIIPFMVLNYNGVLYSYYVGGELRRPGRTYLYASTISILVLVVLWVGVWALLRARAGLTFMQAQANLGVINPDAYAKITSHALGLRRAGLRPAAVRRPDHQDPVRDRGAVRRDRGQPGLRDRHHPGPVRAGLRPAAAGRRGQDRRPEPRAERRHRPRPGDRHRVLLPHQPGQPGQHRRPAEPVLRADPAGRRRRRAVPAAAPARPDRAAGGERRRAQAFLRKAAWVGGATTVLALFTVFELVTHSSVYGKFSWESILTLVIVLGAGPVIYVIARSVRRQRDALDLSMAMHELPPE